MKLTDKQFLQWVHDRLKYVYGEDANLDYMHKLRAIIRSTDPDEITPNIGSVDDPNDSNL